MGMPSSTTLHKHWASMMRLAESGGLVLTFNYNNKVFIMNIATTDDKYVPQAKANRVRHKDLKKHNVPLITQDCPFCGSLVIAGICISKKCPGVHKKALK